MKLTDSSSNDTMKDLYEAGYTKDQVLDALRILPFVCDALLSVLQ